jgi:hypothetical protein
MTDKSVITPEVYEKLERILNVSSEVVIKPYTSKHKSTYFELSRKQKYGDVWNTSALKTTICACIEDLYLQVFPETALKCFKDHTIITVDGVEYVRKDRIV